MDLLGVTRTIDHAVYMLLNALAIILWRVNSALIGISLLGYNTQDWLTGSGGGVWRVAERVTGPSGILGLATWQAFLLLAVMLFGLSRVARPFVNSQPVDLTRLFFFAVMSYVVISQGSQLMQDVEAWRSEAGSYMYRSLSAEDGGDLDIPGSPAEAETMYSPSDLDGQAPIRGWEAVATSYFLVQNAAELHAGVPPADFRREYCLYDPGQPIDEQDEENGAGCSPQRAWDEWDLISTQGITQVWGIPLPDISLDIPVVQEHPENRQLAIRQAQAGVARLALGPVVALFPLLEANISLMLALSAAFLYLSLPITLLFGFFLKTESMATQLLLQLITVMIRTVILNGLVALFLMLLISVSLSGSLMTYLGLVGVGLAGGLILSRFAAATMKDSFSQSLGAVGGVFVGATAASLGSSATGPARAVLGVSKLAGTAAMLGVAGFNAIDLAEAGYQSARSGVRDLNQASPEAMGLVQRSAGQLPAPLARLAQSQLTGTGPEHDPYLVQPVGPGLGAARPLPEVPAGGSELPGFWEQSAATVQGSQTAAKTGRAGTQSTQLDPWLAQFYRNQAQGGRGQAQLMERGRDLLGEELAGPVARALIRRPQAEAQAVLSAARQVAAERPREALIGADGQLQPAAVAAVRARLPQADAFQGPAGQQDLAALTAAALQRPQQAAPADFRRVVAQAEDGDGEQAPGRAIPRQLGLDQVAAQGHLAALNRFVRLSEQAGLSLTQRQQLLSETQQGEVSPGLRQQLKLSLQRQQERGQAPSLQVEALVAGAQALPPTLMGPQRIKLEGAVVEARDTAGKRTLPQKLKSPPEEQGAPPAPEPATQTDSLPRPVSGRVAGSGPRPDRPNELPKKAVKNVLSQKKVLDEEKHAAKSDYADATDAPPTGRADSGRGPGRSAQPPADPNGSG